MSKRSSIQKPVIFSAIAFCLIAVLFGAWSQYNVHPTHDQALNLQSGTAFKTPRALKPFELKNAPTGSTFSNQQLKGHWSLLFFGFTHCALLCPTTLTSLNHFYQNLVDDQVSPLPQIYFVSIDPERDSLQRINSYVTSFNKAFKGATGSESQIEQLTQELNILFAKVKSNQEDEDYQIDHSGTVLLFNPNGDLAALFSPPIDAKLMAEDFKAILKQAAAAAH